MRTALRILGILAVVLILAVVALSTAAARFLGVISRKRRRVRDIY